MKKKNKCKKEFKVLWKLVKAREMASKMKLETMVERIQSLINAIMMDITIKLMEDI